MDDFSNIDNTSDGKGDSSTNQIGGIPTANIKPKQSLQKVVIITIVVILVVTLVCGIVILKKRGKVEIQNSGDTSGDVLITSTPVPDEEINAGYYDYSSDKLLFAEKGNVVLFFSATWCPSCLELEADIQNNMASIGDNLLILRVDYDNSEELKSKYSIDFQHSFVQVDASGQELNKWYGSLNVKDIQNKLI